MSDDDDAKPRCGVKDFGPEDPPVCGKPFDHPTLVHREDRDGKLYGEWKSVLAGDELTGSPERTAFVGRGGHGGRPIRATAL